MTRKKTSAVARSTAAASAAAVDTATTLAFRLPVLFGAPLPAAFEWHRAATEKALAATAGAIGAGFELQRIALNAGFGRLGLQHLPDAFGAVADAAVAPAYAAVAANAHRLSRPVGRRKASKA